MKKNRRKITFKLLTLAVSSLIFVGCSSKEDNELAILTLDINPSIELVVDKQGKIDSINAVNDDAKNVLKDIYTRHQTSPINIVNDEIKIEKEDNLSYTEKVTRKLESEYKPQTIELTDYEKKQEEEAIISYKELLSSSKDKLYNITEEEETTDFIKELKSFRSSL